MNKIMARKKVKWWHYVAFAIILSIALFGESIIDNLFGESIIDNLLK